MHRNTLLLIAALGLLVAPAMLTADDSATAGRKIVLIAGPITGHPKFTHEYEKSVILLKHLLDTSPSLKGQVTVETHFNGWPADEKTLDNAATIVMISDGSDRDEVAHPLYVGERLKTLERQMRRGCGFIQFHWTTFNPSRVHDQITEWVGGYFDYQTGTAPNKWFSAIQTWDANVTLGQAEHPILHGVKPFSAREEFYYNLRFRDGDDRLQPIWLTKPPGQAKDHVVAWAVQRKDGGRGFGTTGGHFFQNWWDDNFRCTILNAIVWTAGLDVPRGGVESRMDEPIRMLIVTGHNHPAHDWRKTTAALIPVLEQDPRVIVNVTENPEDLAQVRSSAFRRPAESTTESNRLKAEIQTDLIVLNYSSWDRPGLSKEAQNGLKKYCQDGGGLSIIHFANGSWTDTLPNKEADWPEFRTQIVRRIWDHKPGLSGHDAFGTFKVELTAAGEKHPITAGLVPFETQDELYFRQQGELPILPLVTAISKVTKQDEPLAWAYEYSGARVFQTVLGHADVSIRNAGALIRRGSVWAARRDNMAYDPPTAITENTLFRSGSPWTLEDSLKRGGVTAAAPAKPASEFSPTTAGRFGNGIDTRAGGAFVNHQPPFRRLPLTVELWAKLGSKQSYNILVANELKSSPTHWEIFTMPGSGHLTVYAPGLQPDHVRSSTDVADGKWHHVAMTFEPKRIRLFVDGEPVAQQAVSGGSGFEAALKDSASAVQGELAIGTLLDQTIRCDGTIDDLRLSNAIRSVDKVPTEAMKVDDRTIALWNFDDLTAGGSYVDASASKLKAWLPGSADGMPASAVKKKVDEQAAGRGQTAEKTSRTKITGHWGEDAVGFKWTEQDSVDDRLKLMDTGRFFSATIVTPTETTLKGIAVRVGDNNEAAVLFDTELLRVSCGWAGEFLRFDPARYGIIAPPKIGGSVIFSSPRQPGWCRGGQFKDPRPKPFGPLPREWAKYRGLFLHGDRVVFKYTVGPKETEVLESPWLETVSGENFITRELEIAPSTADAELLVASAGTNVKLVCEPNVATLERHAGKSAITVKVVAHEKPVQLKLFFPVLANSATSVFKNVKPRTPRSQSSRSDQVGELSLRRLVQPGPPRWTADITTCGVVSDKEDALVVDTLTLPFDNPYKALMFVGGHDFLEFVVPPSGGRNEHARGTQPPKGGTTNCAAICTLHGDVWLVSGIDDKLEKLSWKRFATGLFQPLGLKIVKDQIYVVGRDQITRLHDTNNDGEADFYENFNNDGQVTANGHEYVTCLETDAQGWFYFLKGNCDGKTDHDGCLLRVSPDGRKLEVVATGFRNANGMGIRQTSNLVPPEHTPNVISDDIITVAPQEGEWTPASGVFQVRQGEFYGYVPSAHRTESPQDFTRPLCWIPRLQDNSSGGQVWVPSGTWKSLSGMPLHLSYGTSRIFLVLREQLISHRAVQDASNAAVTRTPASSQGERAQERNSVVVQGATVPLPLSFDSGVMRGRFCRTDGHLYVSGLRGWVSNAAKDACFQRVRYTGAPFDLPLSITAFPNGVLLKFSDRLDSETAEDPDNYRVQQWNYRWSAAYGSPEFKVSNPSQEGRDEVEVLSATMVPPEWGHAVFVELSNVQPVNQLSIQLTLKSAEGRPIERRVDATINAVGRELFPFDKKPQKARPGQLADEVRERLVPGMRLSIEADPNQSVEIQHERLLRMAAWRFEPQDLVPQISILQSPVSTLTFFASGYVVAPRRGRYLFSIDGDAPAELSINDRVIWQSEISQPIPPASPVELARGFNKLRIVQRVSGDACDKPISLRLLWSGDSFEAEPVPPTALFCEPLPELMEVERHGRELFAQRQCLRCHRVSDDVLRSRLVMPELQAEAPDLIDAGSRLRADGIADWLLHPERFRNHSAMPRFFPEHCTDEQKQQAADLAVYLSSLKASANESPRRRTTPLLSPRPEGGRGHNDLASRDVERAKVLWEDFGCIACHRLKPSAKGEPLDDDWGRASLAHVTHKFQPGALQAFLQQPQRHFAWSRMPDFQLSADEAAALAALLERESSGERTTPDRALPQGDVKRGRESFEKLGCRQCHRVTVGEPLPMAHLSSVFGKVTARGCLSTHEQLPPNVPDFRFEDGDRNALLALLRRSESVLASDTPDDISRRFLTELRCAVCHPRDGRMSLLPEVLAEEGEQGKPPEIVPNLTWTGEKLHTSWLTALFAGHLGERPRPWLRVRMPSFPARARFLAEGLAREHGLSSKPERRLRIEQELLPIGEYLATRQGGLDCRQCHAIGALPPTGDKNTLIAPGINFAHIRERMRYDFFRRFTLDPPRYDVTTRMPKLAVDGRTTKVTNVLEGDARRQFESVWHFLQTVSSSTADP